MKQSQLFTKTLREAPKDEISKNSQLLIRAGYIDKLMAGVYTFLPLGWRVMQKIRRIIKEEMDELGAQEIFMPSLQPKELWEQTGRWTGMDDLYKVKDQSEKDYALAPTHEEVVTPLLKKFAVSYKDLPRAVYQIQTKFRMELRAKSGLLRGREFMMKDLYSFHTTEADLQEYYEKAKQAYWKIWQRLGLKEQTHLTFASGGTFSKYSHEFQTICPAGEDTIYVCVKCGTAINKEVKADVSQCPECQGEKFSEAKAIEIGNIFLLNTKYSSAFDYKVPDASGKLVPVLMGCYGIGLSRVMGTLVEVLADESGLVWPKAVAPFSAHLVLLDQKKVAEAEKLYQELSSAGWEILFDDRQESAGVKLHDADLLGLPIQLIMGDKTKTGEVEIKYRASGKKDLLKSAKIAKLLEQEYSN